MKKMKLGLIGWYNHANYGDDRILYCLRKTFTDYDIFVVNGWEDARSKINELNKCDYILIGGGGLILGNCWQNTDIILNLKRPFGFIGISIETKYISKNMENFLSLIKERAEFILVRDEASRSRLNYHYKTIIGPDLTFLYPFNIVTEVKDDICGINLREWHYWRGNPYGYYYFLMKKIINKLSIAKKVYPLSKWEPDRAIEIIKKDFKKIIPTPFYFEKDVVNDINILSRYFSNVPKKIDMDVYKNIRYIIGMRFHAIVFAVQCGVPFVSLSYQPKNISFCADMNLDMLSLDIYKIEELENKIEYIKKHYQQIRKQIILYRQKSADDIKYIFQSLLRLIK